MIISPHHSLWPAIFQALSFVILAVWMVWHITGDSIRQSMRERKHKAAIEKAFKAQVALYKKLEKERAENYARNLPEGVQPILPDEK